MPSVPRPSGLEATAVGATAGAVAAGPGARSVGAMRGAVRGLAEAMVARTVGRVAGLVGGAAAAHAAGLPPRHVVRAARAAEQAVGTVAGVAGAVHGGVRAGQNAVKDEKAMLTKNAAFQVGFGVGLRKSAGMGDNQPGPQPGNPAPPHSSGVGKKLLVAGGALAAAALLKRPVQNLASREMGVARQVAQDSARKAMGGASGPVKAPSALQTASSYVGHRAQQARDAATGAVGKVRQRYYQSKMPQLARDIEADRHGLTGIGGGSGAAPAHAAGAATPKSPTQPGMLRRNLRRAAWIGGGTAALGAGAIAGASGASRANQPQADDQPGLGR